MKYLSPVHSASFARGWHSSCKRTPCNESDTSMWLSRSSDVAYEFVESLTREVLF